MRRSTFAVLTLTLLLVTAVGCGGGTSNTSYAPSGGGTGTGPTATSLTSDEPTVRFIPVESTSQLAYERGLVVPRPQWIMQVNGVNVAIRGATVVGKNKGDITQAEFDYVKADMPAAGVNCLRTYGSGYVFDTPELQAQDASAFLDMANDIKQKTGKDLYVVVGLNLAQHRSKAGGYNKDGYVDYNDISQVRAQYEGIVDTIQKVIAGQNQQHQVAWCVGNEILVDDPTTRANIFNAINDIVKYLHSRSTLKVASAFPVLTTTVINEISTSLPDLDVIAVNTFYGKFGSVIQSGYLDAMGKNFGASNWTKPWVVSEFYSYDFPLQGATVTLNGKTQTLELNSTANAQNFTDSYNLVKSFMNGGASAAGCIGGFALNWQPPTYQDIEAYWKHMYIMKSDQNTKYSFTDNLKTPDRTAAVEAMRQVYGGTGSFGDFPVVVTPPDGDLQGLESLGKDFKATLTSQPVVNPGDTLQARVKATGPSGMTAWWYLEQSTDQDLANYGGLSFVRLKDGVNGTAVQTQYDAGSRTLTSTVTFTLPGDGNRNYRLRAVIRANDGGDSTPTGNCAVASAMVQTGPKQP